MTTGTLLEKYEKTAGLNRRRLCELEHILNEFEAGGIHVLPLKGADLLGRAYGGMLGLRPMVDVDLLFRPEDLPDIERILEANGFQPRGECGNPTYVSATQSLSLDLFPDIWYLDDTNAVWERSVTRRIGGKMRPAMHPEDSLVYLVAYQTIHRGRLSPQMALDIAVLLDAEGQFIDWRNVIDQATTCHLRLPLYHGLTYALGKSGANIPPWVLEALRPPASQRAIARLYQRLVTEDGIRELGYFLLVFSRPGYKNKILALWDTFFPSQGFLALRYGQRNLWGRLWVRLTRCADLVRRGGRLVFLMGRRLLLGAKG